MEVVEELFERAKEVMEFSGWWGRAFFGRFLGGIEACLIE